MQLFTWLRTLSLAARPFAGRTRRKLPCPCPPARRHLLLEALEDRVVPSTMALDSLYVGDNATNGHSGDNSVQRFDATTKASLGTFVAGSDSLKGVRGMVFDGNGHLLVANQNVGRGKPGEILKYDAQTGAFEGELVPFQDPNAPFAPRGMVLKGNVLYVANLTDGDSDKAGIAPDGEIDKYNATTGQFLGDYSRPAGWVGQFNPRSVVFGPDGNLYVSVFDSSNLKAGYVERYDVTSNTGTGSLFAFNNGDSTADVGEATNLHRPEGLTFGPDGNLYVTGYRADATDTDKIVILNTSGVEVNNIALDTVGQPRAYGQGILFGPNGRLFVPISTLDSPDTGAIRSYDVTAKMFTNFEPPGTLGSAWYLTFGNTDPATLAYHTGSAATASTALNQVAAALAQPPGTPTASTVPPTLPGGLQALSAVPSGSSAPSVAAMTTSVLPTASAAPTGANDRLFAAGADDLLFGERGWLLDPFTARLPGPGAS